ncbi:MAG: glycosyltransferase family 2 protein [Microcoleus sp. PH2017_19_SFW_U_A]|nr:glycosyltransferase family 2 protein [Microcoleus sp. PH2017_19_SFW_U_A]
MTSSSSKIPVSVLIPAKDEELNLPACLASIARADEVFMVDSQSSDRTVEIAISSGAKVVQFYFDNRWPKKKNWSLDNLPFRNEWVLIVDCDERIPPELWDEIARAIADPNFDGYYLNRKVFFLGQWLRYGGRYPDWNLRLFKHQKGRYENLGTESVPNTGDNEVHEHVILAGQVGYLKHDMIHEDYRDLFHWIERHNRYSNWEARVYYNIIEGFILFYFIQLGFLDGKAGYIYARLLSQYEYQINAKLYELRSCGGQLNVAESESTLSLPVVSDSAVETKK